MALFRTNSPAITPFVTFTPQGAYTGTLAHKCSTITVGHGYATAPTVTINGTAATKTSTTPGHNNSNSYGCYCSVYEGDFAEGASVSINNPNDGGLLISY